MKLGIWWDVLGLVVVCVVSTFIVHWNVRKEKHVTKGSVVICLIIGVMSLPGSLLQDGIYAAMTLIWSGAWLSSGILQARKYWEINASKPRDRRR